MNTAKQIDISVVVPVFNEESNLKELVNAVKVIFNSIDLKYEIVFVDDGSTDRSADILKELHEKHKDIVKVIYLSRNHGHQLALTAGLRYSHGKAVVIMDADLQDPPEVILSFIKKWQEGNKVVYGVRKHRQGESFFKLFTAKLFYKLIRRITSIDIPANVGDFYLLDRKVVDVLNSLNERHRFLRGLTAWAGFKRASVEYIRKPRHSGVTKYSLWKMVKFSFDAITSFSFAPLRLVFSMGIVFSSLSFFYILVIFYQKIFIPGSTVQGWASIVVLVLFIGGIQLISLGLIGEYIARIGDDVKARPLYSVSEILE